MPAYTVGRWTVEHDPGAGLVRILDSGVEREVLSVADFEARGTARPAFVPTNQASTFALPRDRTLFNIADLRLGVRHPPSAP